MNPIHILPDELINKIAAGEVIERPASVVKELVENSLDAKATRIDIDIAQGGKKSIRVRDNGHGIPADQMLLAVSRHATSKISGFDDLFSMGTLGFRGEALASIASVSQLTLTSAVKGSQEPAHEIYLESGKIISEQDTGHPDGTTVSVKFLFYQTPARLKFLKGDETELSHITDYITRAALSSPSVSFHLTHHGKTLLKTNVFSSNQEKGSILKQRAYELFGKDMLEASYEFQGGSSGLEVCGLAGHPQISRSHNRNMYVFVNGRPVRDKVLYHAALEAYRDLLMRGRYPFLVLFVRVPSPMVDINVHPAKSEVRFSNSSVIHQIVYETIRKALQAEPWKKEKPLYGDDGTHFKTRFDGLGARGGGPPPRAEVLSTVGETEGRTQPRLQGFEMSSRHSDFDIRILNLQDAQQPMGPFKDDFVHLPKQANFGKNVFSYLQIIGQLMGTYVVCDAAEKLVLIDQHAAHERIGFEKLLLQYKEGAIASQQLLIPRNFDLNPSDSEILKKYLEELKNFGLEIEFFGGNTFVVKAEPVIFQNKVDIKSLVLDLSGDILEKGKLTSLKDHFHEILASLACHSAIRAHDPLTLEEMRALLRELDAYPFTSFCPHGRPVCVEVERYEIEKWFKRVV